MRLDLGQCIRQASPEVVQAKNDRNRRLLRSRWWICIESLRLICVANSLDCSALDTPDVPPLEWVICLVDSRAPAGLKGAGAGRSVEDELQQLVGAVAQAAQQTVEPAPPENAEVTKAKKKKNKSKAKASADAAGVGTGGPAAATVVTEPPQRPECSQPAVTSRVQASRSEVKARALKTQAGASESPAAERS